MADDLETYTVVPAAPGELAALLDIEDGALLSQVTVPIVGWRIPKRPDLAPLPVPAVAVHGKTAVFVYLPDGKVLWANLGFAGDGVGKVFSDAAHAEREAIRASRASNRNS